MKTVHDKLAVVTGAGSGIGQALSLALATRGADLALLDVNEEGLRATQTAVRELGRTASTHVVDVTDIGALRETAAAVEATHGRVDLLANIAGIAAAGTVADQPVESFKRVIDINLLGVVHGVNAFLPMLLARPEAHIVNMSSVLGIVPLPGQTAYVASKFAVRGYTHSLAVELEGSPVRVTCVHPGTIRTNILHTADFTDEADRDQFAHLMARYGMPPEKAATKILRAVRKNKRAVIVGADAKLFAATMRWIPAAMFALQKRVWLRSGGPDRIRRGVDSARRENS